MAELAYATDSKSVARKGLRVRLPPVAQSIFNNISIGSIPKWLNGADCKSAGYAFGGSNPPRPTILAWRNGSAAPLHGEGFKFKS